MAINKQHAIDPDKCTACTICITACPVTAATRKFRGPKMTGPALTRLRKLVSDDDPMLDYCSNCKTCDLVCPSGVPISTLNMMAKNEYYKTHPRKSRADDMLAHSEKMGKLITALPMGSTFAGMGMAIGKAFNMMNAMGITQNAKMPTYASESFISKFKKIKQTSYPRKVVFFSGCYINYNQPEVGVDLVKVYQKNEVEVAVDEKFVCCGSPMVSGGYIDDARINAAKNVKLLKGWVDKGYDIVTACTSCGLMLKQEYQELFDFAGMADYAEHMYDSIEYLAKLNDEGKFNTDFVENSTKYIYHAPCHLKVQAIGRPSMELLPLIPGMQIEEADAGCCGISGSYGFKADKNEIAMKVGSKLFARIKNSHADLGVSECGTCRLQMENGSGVHAIHPLTVFRKAYGL
ncbi:anaerobic glycerol-3-phosphate dehydrogenase subunit C [Pectinatus frisingensis]|uniref:anaerobic glycerol-3-phosphate dehydrogenase subunit C n=1 Tax=Pectinatus frisingensis TaxID=865 RepID=UPI0018C73EC1|nr:anaerobic glycerol-3-phosphate dehydrogenase subunit C [Pectinatus frisingensis]